MRGSPLFRTLLVLVALLGTGLGLTRLTGLGRSAPHHSTTPPPHEATAPAASAPAEKPLARYRLVLSGRPRTIELTLGGKTFHEAEGRFAYDADQPTAFLKIAWAESGEAHRFAKLTLEIPGKPTVNHVFEGPGDLDDVWEIEP